MGSLIGDIDEAELEALIFGESSVGGTGNIDEQPFAAKMGSGDLEEDDEDDIDEEATAASGPCSNDNPQWDEGTQPCANATFVGFGTVFDGVTETPSTITMVDPEGIVENEFDGDTDTTGADDADAGDTNAAGTDDNDNGASENQGENQNSDGDGSQEPGDSSSNGENSGAGSEEDTNTTGDSNGDDGNAGDNQDTTGGGNGGDAQEPGDSSSNGNASTGNDEDTEAPVGDDGDAGDNQDAINGGGNGDSQQLDKDDGDEVTTSNDDGNSAGPTSNDFEDILDFTLTTSPTGPPVEQSGEEEEEDVFTTSNVEEEEDDEEYPTFYSCSGTEEGLGQGNSGSIDGNGNEQLPLRFDYEMYTAASVDDISAVLDKFERQLANGVASSLGLLDCNPSSPPLNVAVRISGGTRRRRNLATPHEVRRRTLRRDARGDASTNRFLESVRIVGLSSTPADGVDTELESCSSSMELDVSSTCSPIIGRMTVWIADNGEQRRQHLRRLIESNSREEQEAFLLDTIESYIEENKEEYLNEDLLHVAYIGQQRSLPADGDGTEVITSAPDAAATTTIDFKGDEESGPSPVLVGLGAALVFLALAAVGIGYAYHRRRRRQRREATEPPPGSFPGLSPEESHYYDDDTIEEYPSHLQDANAPSEDLFGLDGARQSDVSSARSSELRPPSSLAVLGSASMLARQLSYSPPRSSTEGPSPEEDVGAQQQGTFLLDYSQQSHFSSPTESSSEEEAAGSQQHSQQSSEEVNGDGERSTDSTEGSQPINGTGDSQPLDTTEDTMPFNMAPTIQEATADGNDSDNSSIWQGNHIGDALVPENVTSEAPTESNEDEVVEEFSGEMV